jgi:hypothetical protein
MRRGLLSRRRVLTAAAGAATVFSAPTFPRAAALTGALKVVLESEVVILDPHFTTAAITRSFGYHVYDTLFAMDERGRIKPQMVDHFESSADRLRWTFELRDGLRWHDGGPVTASDCVASLERWAPRDAMGRLLMASTQSREERRSRRDPKGGLRPHAGRELGTIHDPRRLPHIPQGIDPIGLPDVLGSEEGGVMLRCADIKPAIF